MTRFLTGLCFCAALACGGCGGGSSIGPAGSTPGSNAPEASASPAAPTSIATASSGPSAAPAPTPTAGASAAPAVTCTDPMSGVGNETWTLSGGALTITVPPYGTFAGTLSIPANSPTGTVVSEGDEQINFDGAPESSASDPAYAARHKDFFMTFRLSQSTTFAGGAMPLLPITIVSTCLTSGTTYFIDVFAGSTFVSTESATASASSVSLHVGVAPNPFPAGTYINAVLSH